MTDFDSDEPQDFVFEGRLKTLRQLERNFATTGNPLYAWDAVRLCLVRRGAPPIPEWLLGFLLNTAKDLFALAEGHDPTTFPTRIAGESNEAHMLRFSAWKAKTVSPDAALRLVPRVLGLSRQGHNAFAVFARNQEAEMAAIQARLAAKSLDLPYMIARDPREVTEEVQKARNSTRESAKRTIRQGRRRREPN